MSTYFNRVSASSPMLQDPVHPESPNKWALAVGLGMVGVVFLFILYRAIYGESSERPPGSLEGKEVSKKAPAKPENVLCIIRIFREVLEKIPGDNPIQAQVQMIAPQRGHLLDSRDILLPKAEDFVDTASFLPTDQQVWLEIKVNQSTIHRSVTARNQLGLYKIKPSDKTGEAAFNTEYIPLKNFIQGQLELKEEQNSLLNKKLLFSRSQVMTLDQGYQGEPLMIENHSDRYLVVQIELKHANDDSFLLSYSVKPHRVTPCPAHLAHMEHYVNKPPKPMLFPLEQIIKDYQAAHKIKHRKELPSPQPKDFSIISINYASHQTE